MDQIITRVEPENQEEFKKFIETGESSELFLKHLEACSTCEEAAADAFRDQARKFDSLHREMHKECCGAGKPCRIQSSRVQHFWSWLGHAAPYAIGAFWGFLVGMLFTLWLVGKFIGPRL